MCEMHYQRWRRYRDPFHKRRNRGVMDAPVVHPLGPAMLGVVRTLAENPGVAFPWYALGSSKSGTYQAIRRLRKRYGEDIILTSINKGYRMEPRVARAVLSHV